MFYGNSIRNQETENIEDLYNNLYTECDNFNKIMYSIDSLNENGIILEIDTSKIKAKIKELWEGLIRFIAKVVEKIKGWLEINKDRELNETIKNNDVVQIYNINKEFGDLLTSKYIHAIKNYIDYISSYLERLEDTFSKEDPEERSDYEDFEQDRFNNEIDEIFKKYGGINKISISNYQCFTPTAFEVKKYPANISAVKRYLKDNKEISNKVFKSFAGFDLILNKYKRLSTRISFDKDVKYNMYPTKYVSYLVNDIKEFYNKNSQLMQALTTASYYCAKADKMFLKDEDAFED
jgi:hypothetical protein